MGETSGYEIMAESNVSDKSDTDINEFIVLTKMNPDPGEELEVETVETLMNSRIESNEQTNEGVDIKESDVYFEENEISSEKDADDYHNQCLKSVSHNKKMKQEWPDECIVSQGEEDRIENEHDEKAFSDFDNCDENPDEETIATFITSAGQQLALYAVEDSDEVFAVAVYSESGEPPTNFQFLMKEDVERLIGEGAVRTVKKPQQMKKQTYQGEFITPRNKEVYRKSPKKSSKLPQTVENTKQQISQHDVTSSEEFIKNEEVLIEEEFKKVDVPIEEEDGSSINDDLTYQDILNSSYFSFEQEALKRVDSEYTNNDNTEIQKQVIGEKDEEITEHSTVQYILNDEDQSDSELTFDEIEKTLQHFDQNKKTKLSVKKSKEIELKSTEKVISNGTISPQLNEEMSESPQTSAEITPEKPIRRLLQTSGVKQKHAPNALLGRKNSNVEVKQTVFIQGSTALICCPISDIETSIEKSCKESPDSSFKIKRPRKQQLTIVDRADSEIIIQPASMVSDEEEEPVPKKRGRRKKRHQETLKSAMKSKGNFSKRLTANERRSRIEIIEIDVENDVENVEDDEDNDSKQFRRRRNIIKEVITIEDGKEKGSSDKENEVIMVGDSDDDEDDKKKGKEEKIRMNSQKNVNATILKCNHCNRTFRQKRALETHSRMCPKSSNTRRRLTTNRTSSRRTNETISALKKQYVCKICQEKFNVVVALARHVRSHYKKKETIASVAVAVQMKSKQDLANTNTLPVSTAVIPQEIDSKKQTIIEQKSKERSNRGWTSKKTSCIDCGRWFASAALLSAHCLQHATKKSEKRLKRCQVCKKLFRSRLIYVRHMHMHNNAKQLQKRIKRTQQSMNTITTLRKRGRPRKL